MQAGKVALSTRLATVAELRALTAARFADYAANLAGPRVALAGVGHDVTSRDLFTMHSESKAGGANTAPMAAAGHPASHGVGHSTNPVGSPHNPQVDASPHLDYPKGSPWASSQARENWVRQLLADPSLTKPATGNAAPDVFQRTHLGPTEVKLTSHGEAIWADGLQLDPDKVVAADAKYVLDPGHPKAMYEGGRPEFVYRQFDDEMRRYKLVLEDSSNPVARLRIVTNSEAAARFLAERARGILGPDADLVVVVLKGLD